MYASETKTYKYKVNITCGGCVASVTRAVRELMGVEEIKADVDSQTVSVKVHVPGPPEHQIQAAIRAAGFDVSPLT